MLQKQARTKEWALWGLNPGPADYESEALTTELSAQKKPYDSLPISCIEGTSIGQILLHNFTTYYAKNFCAFRIAVVVSIKFFAGPEKDPTRVAIYPWKDPTWDGPSVVL